MFRIEDTDSARDSPSRVVRRSARHALRWLGPGVGRGPRGRWPARAVPAESARRRLRRRRPAPGREPGWAYESFSTPEETQARRKAAGQDTKLGYDNADRHLTDEREGGVPSRGSAIRSCAFAMPDHDLVTWDDLVRGEVSPSQREHGAGLRDRPRQRTTRSTRWSILSTTRSWRSLTCSGARTCCPVDPAAARDVCTALAAHWRGDRCHAAVRAPAVRDGRGQQEALQAGSGEQPSTTIASSGYTTRGAAELPRSSGLGHRGRTATFFSLDGDGLVVRAVPKCQRQPRALRPRRSAEAINAAQLDRAHIEHRGPGRPPRAATCSRSRDRFADGAHLGAVGGDCDAAVAARCRSAWRRCSTSVTGMICTSCWWRRTTFAVEEACGCAPSCSRAMRRGRRCRPPRTTRCRGVDSSRPPSQIEGGACEVR